MIGSNADERPLIAHIIYRLGIGGLENGLVNLINHMPEVKYRHVIICMTEYTDFRYRIYRKDVEVYQLHKREGKDTLVLLRLWKLLRKLKPDIVHTRNLGALECAFPAFLAGVNIRIHGEHGRDMSDIDGSNKKYIILRKIFRPIISKYIALSKDLENWLHDSIGVSKDKIVQLYNGVDCEKFSPMKIKIRKISSTFWFGQDIKIIGTVGRISAEKDQFNLVRALAVVFEKYPNLKDTLRLMIVGDGPLICELNELIIQEGLQDYVWLPGARDDISELFDEMHVFVLPSLGEGISNTILESMASGLPVIATNVGGNPELVIEGETGTLVPAAMPEKLAEKIIHFCEQPGIFENYGRAGKRRAEKEFSMKVMVNRYLSVYDGLINKVTDSHHWND